MSNYLAIETDTHAGHRQGLCNPETVIPEETPDGEYYEYTPNLTATQKYLWDLRENNIRALEEWAGGERIDYLHAGDQTQGGRFKEELVSSSTHAQLFIALANSQPVLSLKDIIAARFVHGTQSHEFGEGTTGKLLQEMYADKYPEKNIRHAWHYLLDFDGLTVDMAHHGPFPGSRTWLKGNVARYYLQDRMLNELIAGKEPPKLYVRGHYHEEIWETVRIKVNGGWHISTLIVVPSMCGLGVYGRQATRSSPKVTNGMVTIKHEGGNIIDMRWNTKTLDLRTKEVL
jgi:hypothetical protein